MNITATIISYNESNNIDVVLDSLSWADEIIIVDSLSTDDTVMKAQSFGPKIKIINQKFLGFGQQKNLAAEHAKNDWIFSIDADEEVTQELKDSILNTVVSYTSGSPTVYNVCRKTNYCGKWILHGGWYPDILARLYKKTDAAFTTPDVHEALESKTNSKIGMLVGDLNHYSFNTVESQVKVNLKYAKLGAKALLKKRNGKRPNLLALFFRPLGKFIECYIIKKGFLDGLAGLIIAINAMYSMFMKYTFAYFDTQENIDD